MKIIKALIKINRLPLPVQKHRVNMARTAIRNFLYHMLYYSAGIRDHDSISHQVTMRYTDTEKAQLIFTFQKINQTLTAQEQAGKLNNLENISHYFFLEGLELFSLAGIDTTKTYKMPNAKNDEFIAPDLPEFALADEETNFLPLHPKYYAKVREPFGTDFNPTNLMDLIADYSLSQHFKITIKAYLNWRKTQTDLQNERLAILAFLINENKLAGVVTYDEFCLLISLLQLEGCHPAQPLEEKMFNQAVNVKKFILWLHGERNQERYAKAINHNFALGVFLLNNARHGKLLSYKNYLRMLHLLRATGQKIMLPFNDREFVYLQLATTVMNTRLVNDNFTTLIKLLNERKDFQIINTFAKLNKLITYLNASEYTLPELTNYNDLLQKIKTLTHFINLIEQHLFQQKLKKIGLGSLFPLLFSISIAVFVPLCVQAFNKRTAVANISVDFQQQNTTCFGAANSYPIFQSDYSDLCNFFEDFQEGYTNITGGVPTALNVCVDECNSLDFLFLSYLIALSGSLWGFGFAALILFWALWKNQFGFKTAFKDQPKKIQEVAQAQAFEWEGGEEANINLVLQWAKDKLAELKTQLSAVETDIILALPEKIALTMPNLPRTYKNNNYTLFCNRKPSPPEALAQPLLRGISIQ